MTHLNRRHILGLLGSGALTACAPALMTARTGDDPFEGGIGGTGIVGLMTGTGSVLVNGLRVEVPSGARIFSGGRSVDDSVLVPGIALSLVARAHLGRFEAVRIDVDAPLTGTLIRQARTLSINGTALQLETGVSAAGLVGRRVVAHGIWRPDGTVCVSLLQQAGPAGADRVSGTVQGSAATGWHIGQTRVRPPRGLRLTNGQFAVASGAFAGSTLAAASVQPGRFRGGQALRQLSVEGFLEPIASAPGFRISGLGHSFDRRLALAPFASLRALYFGPYDGRFIARRAVTLPGGQGARQALLRPKAGANVSDALTGTASRPIAVT